MTSKEALKYLDDIAHGRVMKLDPHDLYLIVKEDLDILKLIKSIVNRNPFIALTLKSYSGKLNNWLNRNEDD